MQKIFLCFLLLFYTAVEAKPLSVSVRAPHAILINPENGAILYEKSAFEPHYPASILKLATALYLLDGKKVELSQRFLASRESLATIRANLKQEDPLLYPPHLLEHDGVMVGLKEGNGYTVETLLHGLLLASGNDAANVLAQGCCGSIDQFISELNLYLKEKGLKQTHFQNPHGLHHPAQLTTAYDMAQIAALCFQNETFKALIKTPKFSDIENTNPMLKQGKYHYPPFIGGKTGYTASSLYNFVGAAEEKGRQLIVVLLGCESSEDRYKDAIALFEAAFCQKKEERVLFAKDHECFTRQLPKGDHPLQASLAEDVTISYYPAEECPLSAKIVWQGKRLPILEGRQVGVLIVSTENGAQLASVPLHAKNTVRKVKTTSWALWLFCSCSLGLLFYGVWRSRMGY